MIIGLLCHTAESDQLFEGPITRSMDRSVDREGLMFSSLKAESGGVVLDCDDGRISRIAEKICRGLDYIDRGVVYQPDRTFAIAFSEVSEPSEVTTFGPDFTYAPLHRGSVFREFTFFDSVRFSAGPCRV